ncbi:MAG: hypothetical protein KGJ79_18900 [Alphaproteobacteria bacterium]|nr:hypothetical protein [Alphaproteobacteria bacterium]MDE2496128.1 hypothetical protein [Alphaproteobacteria bacterium]
MKITMLLCLLVLTAGLSGCAAVDADLHNTGGLAGDVGNSVILATNNDMQLYRAAFVFAFLSRMGAETINDPDAAQGFYWYMRAVNSDLDRLGGHLEASVQNCAFLTAAYQDCPQLFEADLPDLEKHMFNLAAAALPSGQLKEAGNDLASGSYWSAAFKIATTAGQELYALHSGVAVYRSEEEILALLLKSDPNNSKTVPNVETAVIDIRKAKNEAYGKIPHERILGAIYAMFDVVQDSCRKIALRANSAVPTSGESMPPPISCAMAYIPASDNYGPAPSSSPSYSS